jgi:macrocin-O-methyltransferase TylF-like protien
VIQGGASMAEQDFANVARAPEHEKRARELLLKLFTESPIPDDQILLNLGLYLRSTILAKILYLNELYQAVINIPGIIVEFGVWWGANLALLESFRSVYEPYNWTRKVVGFDTFRGYGSVGQRDGASSAAAAANYSLPDGYEEYLSRVLDAHEADNVISHIKKYFLVKGNVVVTVDKYLESHPETMIALAYFDLALYEPTKKCLEAIKPHLVRGSILAMDELNSDEFPGETIALREVFGLDKYKIVRSRFLPDRSYIIVE